MIICGYKIHDKNRKCGYSWKEVKRDYIESPNIKTPEKRCKSYNKGYCNKYNCKCFRCVIYLNNKKRKKRIKNISI